ncbi:hypothetical protein CDIK_1838 [Cucumispora dikerogammari]|nr:hypothetical protein CDIK_1838 [Cucumispora dikerogammari]
MFIKIFKIFQTIGIVTLNINILNKHSFCIRCMEANPNLLSGNRTREHEIPIKAKQKRNEPLVDTNRCVFPQDVYVGKGVVEYMPDEIFEHYVYNVLDDCWELSSFEMLDYSEKNDDYIVAGDITHNNNFYITSDMDHSGVQNSDILTPDSSETLAFAFKSNNRKKDIYSTSTDVYNDNYFIEKDENTLNSLFTALEPNVCGGYALASAQSESENEDAHINEPVDCNTSIETKRDISTLGIADNELISKFQKIGKEDDLAGKKN